MRSLAILSVVLSAACGGGGIGANPQPLANATATPRPSPDRPEVLLATTTSTQDSGLLEVLVPDFEKESGYRVKTTAVGTGAALALGAKGDADVLLVHAISAELTFMEGGNGERRALVMHNDFVLVGPPSDPGRVKGLPVLDGLRAVAATQSPFISRGDKSGTDILEKSLFTQAKIAPTAPWYVESGTGMGQSLTVASEKKAYIITDRATFLARRAQLALEIVIEGGTPLLNPYHVITVSQSKFPRVNRAGANAFADYLLSARGQEHIAAFGKDKFGQPLFFADAGKLVEDLR